MRLAIVYTCAILATLFLQSADAGKAKIKKIKASLPPMSEPFPWKRGYTRFLLLNEKTEFSETLIARTSDGEAITFKQTTGCEYSRREHTFFAPSIRWRDCPGRYDGSLTYETKGEVWPLTTGKEWTYRGKIQNVLGQSGGDVRKCKVKGVYRVKVEAGEYETYRVNCNSPNWKRTWYVSPELKTWVHYKETYRTGYKTRTVQLIQEEHP